MKDVTSLVSLPRVLQVFSAVSEAQCCLIDVRWHTGKLRCSIAKQLNESALAYVIVVAKRKVSPVAWNETVT